MHNSDNSPPKTDFYLFDYQVVVKMTVRTSATSR